MEDGAHYIYPQGTVSFPPGTCELYRAAFVKSPWNEGRRCAFCGRVTPTLDEEICCGKAMEFYWTDEELAKTLEAAANDRLLVFYVENGVAVGLAAAQVMTMKMLRAYLKVHDGFMPESPEDARVIYLADMAVTPKRQGNKIGSGLFYARQARIEALGLGELPQFVRVRRAPESSLTFKWYVDRKNKPVVYAYPEDDGRVVVQMR